MGTYTLVLLTFMLTNLATLRTSLAVTLSRNTTALIIRTNYGFYGDLPALPLNLGLPEPQKVWLKIDIQSSVTTVECGNNTNSATGFNVPTIFDTSKSDTFRKIRCPRGNSNNSYAVNCTAQETLSLQQYVYSPDTRLPGVRFRCAAPSGNGSRSVAGLAPGTNLSLPVQVAQNSRNVSVAPGLFGYCLPGFVIFGKDDTYFFRYYNAPVSSSGWPQAELVKGKRNSGYSIGVSNITVGGKPVEMPRAVLRRGKPLTLKLSTVELYTKLESSLYKAVRASVIEAIGFGQRVNAVVPVEPFNTCFSFKASNMNRHTWWPIPDISFPSLRLHLDGGDMNVWRIGSQNLFKFFVHYNSDLNANSDPSACLAILDAGPRKPSVLGYFQQQYTFLQFDVSKSKLNVLPMPYPPYDPENACSLSYW